MKCVYYKQVSLPSTVTSFVPYFTKETVYRAMCLNNSLTVHDAIPHNARRYITHNTTRDTAYNKKDDTWWTVGTDMTPDMAPNTTPSKSFIKYSLLIFLGCTVVGLWYLRKNLFYRLQLRPKRVMLWWTVVFLIILPFQNMDMPTFDVDGFYYNDDRSSCAWELKATIPSAVVRDRFLSMSLPSSGQHYYL